MGQVEKDWLARQKIDDKSLMAILRGLATSAEDGVCHVTQARLAKKVAMSDRNIRRGLSALEVMGVIHRTKQTEWGKRGRATDIICLSIDLDFDVRKESVVAAKSGEALSGQMSGASQRGLSGQMSGAPTHSPIRRIVHGSDGTELHRCTGRVFWERDRDLWRAKLTVDGVELDLGRHEARDLAEAEIVVALREIELTATHSAGTPVHPKLNPSLQSLTGKPLADFLFGTDQERRQEAARAAGRRGSGGSSPGQGCGDEIPASRSEHHAAPPHIFGRSA